MDHQPVPWPQQGQPRGMPMHDTDRQMIRHLARKYPIDQLARLFEEESIARSDPDQAPAVSGSSSSHPPSLASDANSIISTAPASIFDDSASSIRSFSDTSSLTGSIISNVSSKGARLLGRRPSAPVLVQQPRPRRAWSIAATARSAASSSPTTQSPARSAESSSASAPLPTALSKQKGTFTCGFCAEEGIPKTCTRKNDLKRHMEDFHFNDAQWFCRQRGCAMVFDWQGAYKQHLKSTHGGSRMGLDEVRISLCPQVVFACGFSGCTTVLEAAGDADASATFKEYVTHVVKHFDEAPRTADWDYTCRMRNLLRQSCIDKVWTESVCDDDASQALQWTPQSSGALRKRLETRHVGDLHMAVQYAFALGSGRPPPDKLVDMFKVPVRDNCRIAMPGHKPRASVQAAASFATAAAAGSDVDSMQFRIQRNTDPGLAAYIASQRSIRAPARPVTSTRARPPPHLALSSSLASQPPSSHSYQSAHFFSPLPPDAHAASPGIASPVFDPRNGYSMGPLASPNGVMHNGMAIQGGDVSMADMGDMPSPYVDTGFHSSMTSDACSLASPATLDDGFYPTRHAY